MVARKALGHWGLEGCAVALMAERENSVWRVDTATGSLAMRVHRPGYRSLAELRSELDWMTMLDKGGLPVARPVTARDRQKCVVIDGFAIDVLEWIDATPLGASGSVIALENPVEVFLSVGETMAWMHDLSDAWVLPEDFARPAWDLEGLLGENPLWGRFWENPRLAPDESRLLLAARERAREELAALSGELDHGLVHADLVPENVMFDGREIHMIDFDDGGFGFRLFDLATTMNRLERIDLSGEWANALLEGYRRRRQIDTRFLGLFQLLRSFTYVGWIVPRMAEPGSRERNARFIDEACRRAAEYMRTSKGGVHG
ncbi:MAG: phosphotransferase [Nitratireductor sp.]